MMEEYADIEQQIRDMPASLRSEYIQQIRDKVALYRDDVRRADLFQAESMPARTLTLQQREARQALLEVELLLGHIEDFCQTL